MPIQDPIEMGLDLPTLTQRLTTEAGYGELFERAFGDPEVTSDRIATALAEFVRSIVSLRSRYDEGLAAAASVDDEFANFTAAENRGKTLFFGSRESRAKACAACHVQPVVVGCHPVITGFDPVMREGAECRNNGVDRGSSRDDPGRGGVTGAESDRGKFRAPSLRNIELTAPYMHDGRFATLDEVLRFYANRVQSHPTLDASLGGGGRKSAWSDASAAQQANAQVTIVGPPPGIPLDRQEREDLIAFLKTLTDRELVRDARFADPFVRPAQ